MSPSEGTSLFFGGSWLGRSRIDAMERIGRGWAGLDFFVTGLLALPPTASVLLDLIYRISSLTPPAADPTRDFFISLAGLLGVIWAWVRLREPKREWILMDTVGRTWVAALILWFVFGAGAPRSLLLFVLTELGGALHQGYALRAESRSRLGNDTIIPEG